MRVARHWTFGLLLLITADFSNPAPGAFSWESSNLFVDAVVQVTAQRDAAAMPVFMPPARQSIEADDSPRSRTSLPVARESFARGTLRSHIKRAQSALLAPSPSEDH